MTFWLAYLYLTLAHSKGQAQGNANFDCEFILKGDKYCYCQNIGISILLFCWYIYVLELKSSYPISNAIISLLVTVMSSSAITII